MTLCFNQTKVLNKETRHLLNCLQSSLTECILIYSNILKLTGVQLNNAICTRLQAFNCLYWPLLMMLLWLPVIPENYNS
jgi:hypothetical protein